MSLQQRIAIIEFIKYNKGYMFSREGIPTGNLYALSPKTASARPDAAGKIVGRTVKLKFIIKLRSQ